MKKFTLIIYSLIILEITLFCYKGLINSYYSSDEWKYFGRVLIDGPWYIFNQTSFFDLIVGRGRLFGTVIQNIFYWYFPYNVIPFVAFGLSVHVLNCILLFQLVKQITKNSFIAFCSGIFFASTSVYIQALSWVVCLIDIPASTFFSLLSIYLCFIYIAHHKPRILIGSITSAYIAFLFKDSSVYLFLLVPVLLLFIDIKHRKQNIIWILGPLFLSFIFFISRFYSSDNIIAGTVVISKDTHSILRAIYHIFWFPFIGIGQILLPMRFVGKFADMILNLEYSHILVSFQDKHLLSSFFLSEWVLMLISIIFIIISTITRVFSKYRKAIVFSVLFYFLSFIPTAMYLEYRGSAFIEPRYMYIPAIGVAIVVGCLMDSIRIAMVKISGYFKLIVMILIISISVFYVYKQMSVVRGEVQKEVIEMNSIRNLKAQFDRYASIITHKPIFYVTSDADFFWDFKNKIPFRLGSGYMLMVIYYKTHMIPETFIRKQWLIDFGQEGYRADSEGIFGFFWDKEKLLKLFQEHTDLREDQIIGLFYKTSKQQVEDVSGTIREYIRINR